MLLRWRCIRVVECINVHVGYVAFNNSVYLNLPALRGFILGAWKLIVDIALGIGAVIGVMYGLSAGRHYGWLQYISDVFCNARGEKNLDLGFFLLLATTDTRKCEC